MESNKMEVAKQLILKHFSFLTLLGYSPGFEVNTDIDLGKYLEVKYLNKEKKRKVTITYAKGKAYEGIIYAFDADIVRMPYVSPKDLFDLDIYLAFKGKVFTTTLINKFNKPEAEEVTRRIAQALQTYASKIIDGTEWYEDYYPRPN